MVEVGVGEALIVGFGVGVAAVELGVGGGAIEPACTVKIA